MNLMRIILSKLVKKYSCNPMSTLLVGVPYTGDTVHHFLNCIYGCTKLISISIEYLRIFSLLLAQLVKIKIVNILKKYSM